MKNAKIDKNLTSAYSATRINEESLRGALELLSPTEEETQSFREKLLAGLETEASVQIGRSATEASDYKHISGRKLTPRRIAYAGGGLAACLCVVLVVSIIASGGLSLGSAADGNYSGADGGVGADVDADSIDSSNAGAYIGESVSDAAEPEIGSSDTEDSYVHSENCELPSDDGITKGRASSSFTWGARYAYLEPGEQVDVGSIYGVGSIDEFFEYADTVAIVRVLGVMDIGAYEIDKDTIMLDAQTARLRVMNYIGKSVPYKENINLMQYLAEGSKPDGLSNFVRTGGVYIVPLNKDGEYYRIYDDLVVLFEVDDTGHIQSHSKMPELKKYDGCTLSELWDDIQKAYNK